MSKTSSPPIIGVSGCRKQIDGRDFDAVAHHYIAAVEQGCRAVPLIVPTLGNALDCTALLAHVDGMLFTGSPSNVEPHHYNGEASREGTLHDPHRDATTLPLLRQAIDTGVPVLCICRGYQELNVVFGGTLHQLVHEMDGMLDHDSGRDEALEVRFGPAHDLDLVDGGFLAGMSGERTVKVNSIHSQGIDRLGDGLVADAHAPDGLIEAVTVRDAKAFALGVQWHPEWKVTENDFSHAIFRAFATACTKD
ncbi:MAG: gamma-glutamyl-gamma-aminobutyrate hydrolase family protein [Rhodospirillaceae bacterium]|nr:gamma-glutamyl-gamma-aminobutyrate hydrolase family protein [Rhodospirillaceae bacterium]